jgi:dTDP-4-dehydrorhamnose reductase
VFALCQVDPGEVTPLSTQATARPAPRPGWSLLGHRGLQRVGVAAIPDWRERLHVAWPQLASAWGLPTGVTPAAGS